MTLKYYLFILAAYCTIVSCKKSKEPTLSTDIVHKVVNRTLTASDPNAMGVDINEDGSVDYSFFAQYVFISDKVHLYIGVNPIGENTTKMSVPDDNHYLNMGNAVAISDGSPIKNDIISSKPWSMDFAFLAIRQSLQGGDKIYEGDWGSGNPQLMPLRLSIKGQVHYGWARLVYDRNTEALKLIDYAWNKNPGQELKAGQK